MADLDVLITNGTILSMNPHNQILTEGAIAIKDGVIVDIGSTKILTDLYEARKYLDATHSVVMPGLIDTYMHSGHAMIKGIWNPYTGWPASEIYFHASTPDFWYTDGLLSAVDRLKNGVTTGVSIFGATPSRLDDPKLAECHIRAIEEVGIRDFIGVGPPDPFIPGQNRLNSTIWKDGQSTPFEYTYEDTIENSIYIVKTWHKKANGRIHVCFAFPYLFGRLTSHSKPGASYKYQEADIPVLLHRAQEIRQLADEFGVLIHTHVFGGAIEFGMSKFGKQQVYELLGPDVILAHANGLTNQEIAIIKENDTKVATAPYAAEVTRYGRCPVPELIENGVCVATSTDAAAPTMSHDLFISIRQEMIIQKYHFQDPTYLPAGKMLRMVTIDAARVLGLDSQIGSLEKGKKADILILDANKAHLTPQTMLPQLLVFYGSGHDVNTVLIDGEILLENRVIKSVNETQILDQARTEIASAFDRFEQLGYRLEPYTTMTDEFWHGYKLHEFPFEP